MSKSPSRYLKTSLEIIRLAVMMYVRFPLSLRNVEDLFHELGMDICHESIRLMVDRFGHIFARELKECRSQVMRQVRRCQRNLSQLKSGAVEISGVLSVFKCHGRFRPKIRRIQASYQAKSALLRFL